MEIDEIVTLEDLDRFLQEHRLFMTLHGTARRFQVTLTLHGGGRPLTGEAETIQDALKKAWTQR